MSVTRLQPRPGMSQCPAHTCTLTEVRTRQTTLLCAAGDSSWDLLTSLTVPSHSKVSHSPLDQFKNFVVYSWTKCYKGTPLGKPAQQASPVPPGPRPPGSPSVVLTHTGGAEGPRQGKAKTRPQAVWLANAPLLAHTASQTACRRGPLRVPGEEAGTRAAPT